MKSLSEYRFSISSCSFCLTHPCRRYKLVYGLLSGVAVWFLTTLLTFPLAPITFFTTPLLMWITLRWFEDAVSSFRAFATLSRLLWVGKSTLARLRERRRDLYVRIMDLAVNELGLPADPEAVFVDGDGDGEGGRGRTKGRMKGRGKRQYFSVRRRRKRDWNETLRLYEQWEYDDI